MALEVTAFSDFVCPWCYIGLAELDRVKAEFDITLTWRPYLLWPGTPDEGRELPERIKQIEKNPDNPMRLRARALGLTMAVHFHVPSTLKAHRASAFAREHGQHERFHRAVLQHYWERGEDISQWSVLQSCAAEAGLDGALMQREVEAGRYTAAVDESIAEAQHAGVSAVPTFVIDHKYLVQGAQEAGTFRSIFRQLSGGK